MQCPRRASLIMCVATLVLLTSSCGRNESQATSGDTTVDESFLAIKGIWDDSGDIATENPDIATFDIEKSQIVPNVRIAKYESQSLIDVYSSLNSAEPAYSGYPAIEDGRYGVWRRDGERHELLLLNGSNGERTRLFETTDVESVSFYQSQQVFVVNADFCTIVRVSGEVRRIGEGRCFGSAIGLRMILETNSGVSISLINNDLQVVDERRFPLVNAKLTALGAFVYGKSPSGPALTVFDTTDGKKVWSSKMTDFNVDVLAESSLADSILVAQDSDDNDNLIDLFSIRRVDGQTVVEKVVSSRTIAAQLSSDGVSAVIATRQESTTPFGFQTLDLETKRMISIDFQGDPTQIAFSSSDYYAYTTDGTLFVGRFGEEPRRAIDVFGNVEQLIELLSSDAFLVVTTDDDQTAMTLVRPVPQGLDAELALTVSGELGFSPQAGSSSRGVLVTVTDVDGYATLYEMRFGSEMNPARLAEGNVRWFSYGPGGTVFYGDVLGGQMSAYSISSESENTRALVSTRFAVIRQGSPHIRETRSGFFGTMRAFVDPTLDLCKKLNIKLIPLTEDPVQFDMASAEDQRPTQLCVTVPLALRNKEFGFRVNPLSPADVGATPDSAIEVLTSEVGAVDPVNSVDQLTVAGSADDRYFGSNATIEFSPTVSSVKLTNPTYMIRGYSWSDFVKATIQATSMSEPAGEVIDFSRSNWSSQATKQKSCKLIQSISYNAFAGGEETEIEVSTDKDGDAEITEFCLRVVAARSGSPDTYRMVFIPVDLPGNPAKLVAGCAGLRGRQTDAAKPYGMLSAAKDIFDFASRVDGPSGNYGNITEVQFSLSKGYAGPCFMTHQSPRPKDAGDGETARVKAYLDEGS